MTSIEDLVKQGEFQKLERAGWIRRYRDLRQAWDVAYRNRKQEVLHGDDGYYWVVPFRLSNVLLRHGYERAPKPPQARRSLEDTMDMTRKQQRSQKTREGLIRRDPTVTDAEYLGRVREHLRNVGQALRYLDREVQGERWENVHELEVNILRSMLQVLTNSQKHDPRSDMTLKVKHAYNKVQGTMYKLQSLSRKAPQMDTPHKDRFKRAASSAVKDMLKVLNSLPI